MENPIRVTIWNEYRHEKTDAEARRVYPQGLHSYIGKFLAKAGYEITLAALDDPEQGLPEAVLNRTDVLIWWGHTAHGEVSDALVEKIKNRVYAQGMGFLALHSAHASKPFCAIVGTSGRLCWGVGQKEIVWNLAPSHPIAKGVPEHFVLPEEEMYGEPFLIPQPDALVFASWFAHGNLFRSGCCFQRGLGKVFYFQPGHETCRSFYDENVQKILINAVNWAAPQEDFSKHGFEACPYREKLL